MSGKRKRLLTPEERRLWTHVSSTYRPLKSRPPRKSVAVEAPVFNAVMPPLVDPMVPGLKEFRPVKQPIQIAQKPTPPKLPPVVAIERKALRAVRRGVKAVDGKLDLHGMVQSEAHYALMAFLRRSQAKGASLVLIVTGKGAPGAGFHSGPDERGVLKRVVPQWLAMPEARAFVVSFGEAAQHHGGTGALYVQLRRARV